MSGERSPGRARRIAFWTATGLASLFVLVALLATYPLLFTNWLPTDAWLAVRADRSPGDQVHRLHSLALGVISWGMLVGLLVQFHRPERRVAALLMTLATVLAVAGGLMLTGTSFVSTVTGMAPFLLPIVAVCALHPSARDVIRLPRLDPSMLALAAIAAGPWIMYAVGLSETTLVTGPSADAEHVGFMVTVAFLIVLWALIGSTDKPGWAIPAGAAVVAGSCIGVQSLVFPDVLSGLEPLWAWAAVAWCLAYGAAAWLRRRAPWPRKREA